MKVNLDRWIKDAKDKVPDSGEYRRLNRVLLKERMLTAGPERRRRHRLLLVFAILIFLLLLSGQLNQAGSTGFNGEYVIDPDDLSGEGIYKHPRLGEPGAKDSRRSCRARYGPTLIWADLIVPQAALIFNPERFM